MEKHVDRVNVCAPVGLVAAWQLKCLKIKSLAVPDRKIASVLVLGDSWGSAAASLYKTFIDEYPSAFPAGLLRGIRSVGQALL